MFFRIKKIRSYRYLQLVENRREGPRTRQRLLATLGQVDDLAASGAVDVLIRSLSRFSVHGRPDEGAALKRSLTLVGVRPLGPELVLRRVWKDVGLPALPDGPSSWEDAALPPWRVLFSAVLQRLFGDAPGRPASPWHCGATAAETANATQRRLDQVCLWLAFNLLAVENFLARRQDVVAASKVTYLHAVAAHLFGRTASNLDSPDDDRVNAPDGVAAVLHTQEGAPLACRLWPGAGVEHPISRQEMEHLGERFGSTSVCCVGDRALGGALGHSDSPAHQPLYVIGTALRRVPKRRLLLLKRAGRLESIAEGIEGNEIDLDGERLIVFRDAKEAAQDAADWEDVLQTIVEAERAAPGSIELSEDSVYGRLLMAGIVSKGPLRNAGREGRYDGLFVVRTNTDLPVSAVVAQYRRLRQVEEFFGLVDSPREGRPSALLLGRVAVRFLGLVLIDELQRRLGARGVRMEWPELRAELSSLAEVAVSDGGKPRVLHTPLTAGQAEIIHAAGVVPPSPSEPDQVQ